MPVEDRRHPTSNSKSHLSGCNISLVLKALIAIFFPTCFPQQGILPCFDCTIPYSRFSPNWGTSHQMSTKSARSCGANGNWKSVSYWHFGSYAVPYGKPNGLPTNCRPRPQRRIQRTTIPTFARASPAAEPALGLVRWTLPRSAPQR